MGLAELRDAATLHARYQAQSGALNLDLGALRQTLSPSAEGFLQQLAGPGADLLDVRALYREQAPWSPSTVRAFADLAHDARLEALIYLAVPVHEYTHHMDVHCTPFGAYLQAQMGYELLAFQDFVEVFLRRPDSVPTGNIASLGQIFLDGEQRLAEPFRSQWRRLDAYLGQARVWRDFDDLPVQSIEPTGERVEVLHTGFHAVSVDGWWPSYTVAGQRDWFIGPVSVLELRGVCASLSWVLTALRDWDGANDVASALVAEIYPDGVGYDYRFALELAAAAGRCASFDELLRTRPAGLVSFCLTMFYRAGWVALHTLGDLVDTEAPRLELADLFLASLQEVDRTESKQADDILAAMLEPEVRFADRGVWGVNAVIERTAGYLENAEAFNTIRNPEIRLHQLELTASSARRLRSRVGAGYKWPPGIAPPGQLIATLAQHAPDLLRPVVTPQAVSDWLSLRRRGFFRPTTALSLRSQIESSFGLVIFAHPCLCGHRLDLALPPEFRALRVTCPECNMIWVFPDVLLHDLHAQHQTGAESLSLDYQELLLDCACGEQIHLVEFVDYIIGTSVNCTRGHENVLSAEQIIASLAAGGVIGRVHQS